MSSHDTVTTAGPSAGPTVAHEPALRLSAVTKVYPGVIALRSVDFDVRAGEVHALVGENGAGKSTLIGVAAGAVAMDRGSISVRGMTIEHPDPSTMRGLGLAVVYQRPALLSDLTVAENLVLGLTPSARPKLTRTNDWARGHLQLVGLEVDPRRRIEQLTVAERHLVEIARALSADPSILILDEPTEPLSEAECERLFDLVARAAQRGVAVVYISHRLRDVERIADRITVLRDGESRGTFAAGDLAESDILRLIVGRSFESAFPAKAGDVTGQPDVLEVTALSGDAFDSVDLRIRAGEIVGLAGIDGNGQREFMRAVAGLVPSRGRVTVGDGEVVHRGDVGAAVRAGVSYMPADRHAEGLLPSLSVRENVVLLTLGQFARSGFMQRSREAVAVATQTEQLAIKAASAEMPVGSLSGGNQQKTVFARTLLAKPRIILADEPTQGVDAGARVELYRHLRDAADRGAGVAVLSSDSLELAGLCDRVLIFSRGHVVAELVGDEVTEEKMTHAALTSTQLRRRELSKPSPWQRAIGFARGDYAPSVLLAAVILALAAYTTARSGDYLTARNFTSFLLLLTALGFVALGQFTVVLLGGVDLSVGPLIGFIVVIGSSVADSPGSAAVLGIGVLIAAAAAVGATNGALVRVAKLPPVIATLVTFFVLQGLALTIRPNPGGSIDAGLADTIQRQIGFVPVAFVVLLACVAGLEWALRFTRWGLEMRGTGSDGSSAHRLGIDVGRRHIGAYVMCSLLTLVGALIVMAEVGVGDAGAGAEFTLSSIAAVVLGGASIFGGRGSFIGVFLGAALLQQTTNVTTFLNLAAAWQYWFVGLLTLAAAGLYSRARTAG